MERKRAIRGRFNPRIHARPRTGNRNFVCSSTGFRQAAISESAHRQGREIPPREPADELAGRVEERLAALEEANAGLQRRLEEIEASGETMLRLQSVIDAALLHQSRDELLHELLRGIRDHLSVDMAALLLRADDGEQPVVCAVIGLEGVVEVQTRPHTWEELAERFAASPQPIMVEDVAAADIHPRLLELNSMRSLLSSRLLVGERLIGVLIMGALAPNHFNEGDTRVVELAARRLAVAIDQARHYYEAREAVRAGREFLAIATHELKTPITALMGYAQLLGGRSNSSLGDRDRKGLRIIGQQADRLYRLINMLLDLSHMETGRFTLSCEAIDLCGLANRVLESVQPTLEQHILRFVCPHDSIVVEADALRIEQVLHNLLQNAVKYCPAGGEIHVELEACDEFAVLSVTDQGIGIPAAAQERLFSRFYRATNVRQPRFPGMGIGLYVVKEIVTRHGGRVEVRSVEGEGSTFTVRLPRPRPPTS